MDVVALYDVHGNLPALQAVLAEPDVAAADAIVVGGDAVPGFDPAGVLTALRGLDVPVHWVRGNGEREVAEQSLAGARPADDDLPALTAWLNARTLGPAAAAELGAIAPTVTVDGVLFCHATPDSDLRILTRDSPPERWAAALAGAEAPLVVAGHTHQQDDRRVGAVRFVNAGSVGMPYEGDAAAFWLRVRDGEPELRRTAYDARAAGQAMLDDGWPDDQSIPASLVDPLPAQEITDLFEARSAEQADA